MNRYLYSAIHRVSHVIAVGQQWRLRYCPAYILTITKEGDECFGDQNWWVGSDTYISGNKLRELYELVSDQFEVDTSQKVCQDNCKLHKAHEQI